MNLIKYDPFREMNEMRKEMSRIFGGNGSSLATLEGWTPSVDIFEDEKAITLKADLPGVDKKDINIEIEGNTITVRGERKLEKEEKKENYHRIERTYGSFTRSFDLPDNVDPSKITAESKDGTLNVTLPKNPAAKPSNKTKVAVK